MYLLINKSLEASFIEVFDERRDLEIPKNSKALKVQKKDLEPA